MLSDNLPKDLMEEIIVRLPVKSLLRFKCVAKSWYALITDQSFITRHYEWSNSIGNDHRLRLVYKSYSHNDRPPSISFISNRDKPYEIQNLELPFHIHDLRHIFIWGQCNGIFCLHGDYGDVRTLILWNPATKEVKVVLTSRWQPKGPYWPLYGFGFDSITKDLKILEFPNKHKERHLLVRMYNLSTDSWKKLDVDVPINEFNHSSLMGPYLNGAYHWLTSNRDDIDKFIVSFDFSKEAFGIMQSPPGISCSRYENNVLAIVDESLSWVVVQVANEVSLEIWVMNEYGVESSWTKKIEIRPFSYSYSWYILQFWGDNEIIVYDDINHQLISYNFRNQHRERLQGHFGTMMDYVETLLPLGGGK